MKFSELGKAIWLVQNYHIFIFDDFVVCDIFFSSDAVFPLLPISGSSTSGCDRLLYRSRMHTKYVKRCSSAPRHIVLPRARKRVEWHFCHLTPFLHMHLIILRSYHAVPGHQCRESRTT